MALGKLLGGIAVLGAIGAGVFLFVTAPERLPAETWASAGQPDLANGARIFHAGGCSSCHAAPGAPDDRKTVLSGGLALKSPFGTFHVPNISPDETAGIGAWTLAEFGDAMKRGTGRDGEHLYPSFPYASYARMSVKDIADLYGYLKTLPKSQNVTPEHDLPFPFNIRLALGGWKFLYLNEEPRVELADADPVVKQGQYLVEGPGHCGECHTPRDMLGGLKTDLWLAGGPNPEGEGRIPDITPSEGGFGSWSAGDIASYLETGFTPEFDSVGGPMVAVQKNMAQLPSQDREAIAAYLKAVPAR